MPLAVKVDEDLPHSIAATLLVRGYAAETVPEEHLSGTPDEQLWPIIQQERRLLMTADKGFADARRYPPGMHEGIILLRPEHESRSSYRRLVEHLVDTHELTGLRGTITVVTATSIRIRRA